jgi:hypothetical protein
MAKTFKFVNRQRWMMALLIGMGMAWYWPADDGWGPRLIVFGFVTIMARMGAASSNNEAQERAAYRAAKAANA